jgi:Tfp pilus assembly protein PilF/wyosine [tRNA(Phe)-imidazoG37] synthetase (radical SAM superfamily)
MKLCPYPFSRIQTNHTENKTSHESFYPCCPSWLKEEYHRLPKENKIENVWNGKAAQELRSRMYKGDFSLCDREACKIPLLSLDELSNPLINFIETPISDKNMEAIKRSDPILPDKPSSLHLAAETVCNLSCKSCRPHLIPNTPNNDKHADELNFIQSLKRSLRIVKMSSSGEVFYSTTQRQILKNFSPEEFPELQRIHIVTNGILFNPKSYQDLLPGTKFIKDVSVSIDAGSKSIYEKIRGPFWEQLIENLNWMSELREKKIIDFLSLNFILLKDNFRDIPNLVKLGNSLNVDRILIQKYLIYPNQGYLTQEEKLEQSVHMPEHPDHAEMISILENLKDEPKLYTFLNVDGYERKIQKDVNSKKSFFLYTQSENFLNNGELEDALEVINESIRIEETHHALNLKALILCKFALKEASVNTERAKQLLTEAYNNEKHESAEHASRVTDHLVHEIYTLQKNSDHKMLLKMTDLFLMFNKPKTEIVFSRAMSFKMTGDISSYIKLIENILKEDPSYFYALIEMAHIMKINKKMNEADFYFDDALKVAPKEKYQEVLFYKNLNYSEKLFEEKNFEGSLEYLNLADKLNNNLLNLDLKNKIYFCKMEIVFKLQESTQTIDQALAIINDIEGIEPIDHEGNARHARYNILLKKAELFNNTAEQLKSLEILETAEKIEPLEFYGKVASLKYSTLVSLGYKYFDQDDFKESINFFRSAISLKLIKDQTDAQNGLYHSLMGLGFQLENDVQNRSIVLSYFEEAKTVEPLSHSGLASEGSYNLLLKFAAETDQLKSLEILEMAEKIEPPGFNGKSVNLKYSTLVSLGYKYFDRDDFKESINLFRSAISLKIIKDQTDAQNGLYHSLMGLGFQLQDDVQKRSLVLTYFEEAKSLEPLSHSGLASEGSYNLLLKIAADLSQKDQDNEALKQIDRAISIEPSGKDGEANKIKYHLLKKIGFSRHREDKFHEAISCFQMAELIEPCDEVGNTRQIINNFSYNYFRQQGFDAQRIQDYSIAVNCFIKALQYGNGDGDLFFSYGISLKRTKHFVHAEECFQKTSLLNPENYWNWIELGCLELKKENLEKALFYFLEAKKVKADFFDKRLELLIKLTTRKKSFLYKCLNYTKRSWINLNH